MDVDADQVVVAHRVSGEKVTHSTSAAVASIASLLDDAQRALFEVARRFRDENTHEIKSYDSFREGIDSIGGFWQGAWCGDEACEDKVKGDTSATIRVLPIEAEDPGASLWGQAPATATNRPRAGCHPGAPGYGPRHRPQSRIPARRARCAAGRGSKGRSGLRPTEPAYLSRPIASRIWAWRLMTISASAPPERSSWTPLKRAACMPMS